MCTCTIPPLKNGESQCLNAWWSCKYNFLKALKSHWLQDTTGLCSFVLCLISKGKVLVLKPHLSQIKLSLWLAFSGSFTSFVSSFCFELVLAIWVCNSIILSLWNLFCSLNILFSSSFSLIALALEVFYSLMYFFI